MDNHVLEIHLRENVSFHDGSTLSARNVVSSLRNLYINSRL